MDTQLLFVSALFFLLDANKTFRRDEMRQTVNKRKNRMGNYLIDQLGDKFKISLGNSILMSG